MTCIVCGYEHEWNTNIEVWDHDYKSKRTISICGQHCNEIETGLIDKFSKKSLIKMDRYEMANLLAFMARHKEDWNGDWEGQIRYKLSEALFLTNHENDREQEATNFGDIIPTNERYSAVNWSGDYKNRPEIGKIE